MTHNDSSDEVRSDYLDNLSVQYYKTENGENISFPIVEAVSHSISQDPTLDHEYLPILGLPSFRRSVARLILGLNSIPLIENRIVTVQTIGIDGALRIAAEFLKINSKFNSISIPTTSSNEIFEIFENLNYQVNLIEHWNIENRSIDIKHLEHHLEQMNPGELIYLENSGQNWSGDYPSIIEWNRIIEIILKKKIFVIFGDVQSGLCRGPDRDFFFDFYPIRKLAQFEAEFIICSTFSNTLALQDNPIGSLNLVLKDLVKLYSRQDLD
jgi:aspartate aminotransferase